MTEYRLSKDAEDDLRDVASYTLENWGEKIFNQYRSGLQKTFNAIANNGVLSKQFSDTFPNLFVAKFRYHFVFYLKQNSATPIIIGVIHEKRDIVRRLSERLS